VLGVDVISDTAVVVSGADITLSLAMQVFCLQHFVVALWKKKT